MQRHGSTVYEGCTNNTELIELTSPGILVKYQWIILLQKGKNTDDTGTQETDHNVSPAEQDAVKQ